MANGNENSWRISKDIPVALIISIACSLVLGGVGYQSLKSDIGVMSERQIEGRTEAKEIKADVRALSGKMQDGNVPDALSAARVSTLESAVAELRGRVAEHERKLQRVEAMEVRQKGRP